MGHHRQMHSDADHTDGPNLKAAQLGADPLGWGFPCTVPPGLFQTAMSVPVANDGYYLRSLGGGPITKIGLRVTAQSGNICLAVYAGTGAGRGRVPSGNPLQTTGSIACPAVGYVEVALPASVTMTGDHFFYIGADNTTATFRTADAGGSQDDIGKGTRYRQATGFPAPSPVGALSAYSGRSIVLVGVA